MLSRLLNYECEHMFAKPASVHRAYQQCYIRMPTGSFKFTGVMDFPVFRISDFLVWHCFIELH